MNLKTSNHHSPQKKKVRRSDCLNSTIKPETDPERLAYLARIVTRDSFWNTT